MKKQGARQQAFAHFLSQSHWWHELSSACRMHSLDNLGCWLVRLRESLSQAAHSGLVEAIDQRIAAGFTLRRQVAHMPWETQVEWFGERLIWMRTCDVARADRWNSLVSSRIGRYGQRKPDWPIWLRSASRQMAINEQVLLWVPGTAVASLLEPVLPELSVRVLGVQLPRQLKQGSTRRTQVIDWLAGLLAEHQQSFDTGCSTIFPPARHRVSLVTAAMQNMIWLSPRLTDESERYNSAPLQDRIAIGWATHVYVFSIRPGGHIEHLLEQRLADRRWQSGKVAIRFSNDSFGWDSTNRLSLDAKSGTETPAAHTVHSWFERGAVGWQVEPTAWETASWPCPTRAARMGAAPRFEKNHETLDLMRQPPISQPVVQPTWPVGLAGDVQPQSELPKVLVHCVRGSQGKLSETMASERIVSAWHRGWWYDATPLENLIRIITSGCLQASSRWNRTTEASVSFSAVPLLELISRRCYQAHLGRWDWEPYGLLIDRQWLELQGARPVIYGNESLYRELSAEQRPYYQPAKRRSVSRYRDWEQEREWRCLGDVWLNEAPKDKVQLFVHDARQATALARHAPWPVIWLMPSDSALAPEPLTHRRCRVIQTSRN